MKKLFNKKTYFIIVIIQVILLVLLKNTITDLYYTGFQNKGFNNKVLDTITAKTYDKYAALMKLEDFDTFDKAYKYNKEKDLYTIKKKYDKKEIERITKETVPMHYLFYQGLQTSSQEVLAVTEYQNIYNVLVGLNNDQKEKILKDARKELRKYNDKELYELVIKDTQLEYKNLGYNINNHKSSYILKTFIKISILLLLLILVSVINILIRKKTKNNYRNIEIIQDLIILVISFIYLFKVKLILTIILLVIYLLLLGCIKILDNLRKQINTYNIELSKLEDVIDTNTLKEKNYIFRWIILPLILFMLNLIVYNRYTTYHIFAGVNPYKFQMYLLYYFILVINIFIYRDFFFQLIEIVKENRPAIKKEMRFIKREMPSSNESNKEKKKKKKKKKSKK
ncbi:MAG: hypothetical protein Q4E69_06905 [Bacilli bacterium]|nr:hypothetical protein [Bacilli bacterium]